MKRQYRIVTNGKKYRVQSRDNTSGKWSFETRSGPQDTLGCWWTHYEPLDFRWKWQAHDRIVMSYGLNNVEWVSAEEVWRHV